MVDRRRALDDPATLARGARIVRNALERQSEIEKTVADWPELTADQKDRLRVLLRPGVSDHIKEVVDRAPPLTAEQRDRPAILLRPN